MKSWYNRSVTNKLTSLVLLAVVPSVMFISILWERREANRHLELKRQQIAGIAATLAAAVSEPLASGDLRQTANALKGIGSIPNLSHVAVFDQSDNSVFQFGAGIVVSQNATLNVENSLSTFLSETPITHSGRPIGRLRLIANLSDVNSAFYTNIGLALLASLIATLSGLLASQRMLHAIASPITQLTNAMRKVTSTGNFEHALERTTSDEIGTLVESFNAMLAEIRNRDGELEKHREHLEDEVRERTSDLAKAKRVAERANRAKSEFLATMSHEIRTPMNGMLVTAELLAASELTPRAQRQCEVILRSGQTLLAIINDVLDLSKIESGHLTLEAIPVDPAAVIEDALRLFSEGAASKGLELAAQIATDVPRAITSDPVRLSQIVSNLVNNAIKFTSHGGVMVRLQWASAARTALRFEVADTGIGIPADKIATIFEPFTQAKQSTTREFGGTGIGLTISRKLVAAMGGQLRAQSEVGQGTVFSFEVPCSVEMHESSKHTKSDRAIATAYDGNILIDLPPGIYQQAICDVVSDLGLRPVLSRNEVDRSLEDLAPTLAIASTEIEPIFAQRLHDHGCNLLVLSTFGDTRGTDLVQRGLVRELLEVPVSSRNVRDIIVASLEGRPVTTASTARHSEWHSAETQFAGRSILAADDSAINREVLREALERLGITVTLVANGQSAVEAVAARRFDLIFMDGSMPRMDGYDATRAIRDWETGGGHPPIPIIGLSAHAIGAGGETWRACGMSDFITKPFTLGTIRNCLEHWLGNSDADRMINEEEKLVASVPATPSSEASTSPLLDSDVLFGIAEMQMPGDDLIARVVSLYGQHAPEQMRLLRENLAQAADAPTIALTAHALKSLSRNIGAQRVGDLCGQVEERARTGELPHRHDIEAIGIALEETIKALMAKHSAKPTDSKPAEHDIVAA